MLGEITVLPITRAHLLSNVRRHKGDLAKNSEAAGVLFYLAAVDAAGGVQNDVVQLLVELGADVNKTDCYNRTVLHHAAAHGYLEIVRLLFYAGANLNLNVKDSS